MLRLCIKGVLLHKGHICVWEWIKKKIVFGAQTKTRKEKQQIRKRRMNMISISRADVCHTHSDGLSGFFLSVNQPILHVCVFFTCLGNLGIEHFPICSHKSQSAWAGQRTDLRHWGLPHTHTHTHPPHTHTHTHAGTHEKTKSNGRKDTHGWPAYMRCVGTCTHWIWLKSAAFDLSETRRLGRGKIQTKLNHNKVCQETSVLFMLIAMETAEAQHKTLRARSSAHMQSVRV